MRPGRAVALDWLIPVTLLAGLTVPFFTGDLDLAVSARFYVPGVGWPTGGEAPWKTLYDYGVLPAWIIALSALVVFLASFGSARARPHRRAMVFLVLAMVIGPGVIVNDVFKEQWGRPRPKDVVEFGGTRAYVHPWVKSPRENGNSFVSGHAATGFYLLTPWFLLRRRRPQQALVWLVAGIAYGALVGAARITQGAHFLSDVLWSLGFVYLTGLALSYALRLNRSPVEFLSTE
jgi:membrane-associated PAP2 superfamily phosphatase